MVAALTGGAAAERVRALVRAICDGPANRLAPPGERAAGWGDERAWGEPLVGYAAGDDPLFAAYKEHVGPYHWTPAEALALAHPELGGSDPASLTVICWVLPQTAATRADSRQATAHPPERWARARIYGEQFNDHLRREVVRVLEAAGHAAAAPALLPGFATRDSARFMLASNWSERHMAYAAGLGTFGLCDGLITPVGKAMRVGSVVAQIALPPTPRPYSDHHAYCLHYARGTCGACIDRCPAGALSRDGHDKRVCGAYVGSTRAHVAAHYGFQGYGCGLCQTGVPCEAGMPTGLR